MTDTLQGLRLVDKKDYKTVSGLVDIPLDALHIRYLPMANLEWFYTAANGYNMMSLVNSPHVKLMKIFLNYGLDWEKIKKTLYCAERKYRKLLGMSEWTKEHLKWHIKKRYKLFKSIQKNGFDPAKRNVAVYVSKKPLWVTRFNWPDKKVDGFEIWNGAGACSAMLALGKTTIPGYYIEDAKPGTMKCRNITKRFPKSLVEKYTREV